MNILITAYTEDYLPGIRSILERIGWAEQYISAAERNAQSFSQDKKIYGVYLAISNSILAGFIYAQLHEWNHLVQIQGLAVDPQFQRSGIASMLVQRAEEFAKAGNARGMYVDTPSLNHGGRRFYEALGYEFGYEMPRYYEDGLDGVTYQKFFARDTS